jgi:asparagine synthase (glutamine-hydrolysing)
MCGFASIIALNNGTYDSGALVQMAAQLEHRGPDAAGVFASKSVGLAFRRLSILDLSPAGNQPMVSPDGQCVLVFNGEIYNYIELRKELQVLGHCFVSSGDSEVLLHAYLEWGRECLSRLNGMWAFLIYDVRRGIIFCSRDRFGEKPLYRYRENEHVLFASEIKAIVASGHYRYEPNWNTVSRFLYEGRLDQPEGENKTFYRGIEQIPAGSAFEVDLFGRLDEWKYWSLPECVESDLHDPAEAFHELFTDALRLRLRSDVPVGLFLSGGLDSTSIACGWANMQPDTPLESVVAFTYQPKEYDESNYVADTVKQTGVQLVQFQPDPQDLWQRLERVIRFQDEPVHSLAAVISFELTRLAAERGIKVILNGGGPDEFLAGYHVFFPSYWSTLLRAGQLHRMRREIAAYSDAHGGHAPSRMAKFFLSQLRAELGRVPALRSLAHRRRHQQALKNPWFTVDLASKLQPDDSAYSEPTLENTLKQAVERHPLPLYLRIEDRNSMAHSVEMRMPYLDHRLVSLAFQLPAHWKMNGPWNKYLLRQAMQRRIPESVRTRLDKFGFPAPAQAWFADGLYQPMQDLLASRAVRERGIYNIDAIRGDLDLHRKEQMDVSGRLFNLAQIEIWSQLHSDESRLSSQPQPVESRRQDLPSVSEPASI